MMKTMKYLSMAALLVVGAIIISCSNNDDMPGEDQPKGQSVTLTTTISLDNGAETRALTEDGKKTFASGDQIAVFYKNTSGNTVKAESAAIEGANISSDKKTATFTVTLESPANNGTLRYIYPAAMAKTGIDTDAAIDDANTVNYAALASQDGTLATLASNCDLCTYDGNLTADAKLPATANLKNQLAICKFTIKNSGGTDITSSITNLTISDGTDLYVVTRTATEGPIYVAMKPVASSQTITLNATAGGNSYSKTVTGQTLNASKLYPINVTMEAFSPTGTPFTIEAKTAGTIIIKKPKIGMKYIKGDVTTTVETTDNITITVAEGDKIQFYGNGTSITGYGYSSYSANTATQISGGTADFYAYGNMMSLLDETGFDTNTTLPAYTDYNYTFAFFFYGNTHLYSHSDKTLELPATTLREGCYYNMFYGCTNLTKAPVLPAATLVDKCYKEMFQGCSNLNYVKCLTEDPGNSSQSFTTDWLSGVSSSGTFVKKSGVTKWWTGSGGIPSGWTVTEE